MDPPTPPKPNSAPTAVSLRHLLAASTMQYQNASMPLGATVPVHVDPADPAVLVVG